MKTIIALALLLCSLSDVKAGPTPVADNWNQLWLDGKKAEVLASANQRLRTNADDIAGLLITLDYELEFSDITHMKATMDQILTVGGGIKTANFVTLFPQLKSDLIYMKTQVIPTVTPQMAQAEAAKGNIPGKPMSLLYVLQAAEKDGLISNP